MTKTKKPQSKKEVPEKSWRSELLAQDFRTTMRTSVTVVVCLFIFVHLMIALAFLLSPTDRMINGRGITSIYKRFALPGPYFRDSLIISSPNFYISVKKNNTWDDWKNPEAENFKTYHQGYWRYDKLKQSSLERHLARQFSKRVSRDSAKNFTTYPEFKILHKYISKEYLTGSADSIRLLYTTSRYKPRERKTRIDTLFYLTYKPW
jgi:hypothetical protein